MIDSMAMMAAVDYSRLLEAMIIIWWVSGINWLGDGDRGGILPSALAGAWGFGGDGLARVERGRHGTAHELFCDYFLNDKNMLNRLDVREIVGKKLYCMLNEKVLPIVSFALSILY